MNKGIFTVILVAVALILTVWAALVRAGGVEFADDFLIYRDDCPCAPPLGIADDDALMMHSECPCPVDRSKAVFFLDSADADSAVDMSSKTAWPSIATIRDDGTFVECAGDPGLCEKMRLKAEQEKASKIHWQSRCNEADPDDPFVLYIVYSDEVTGKPYRIGLRGDGVMVWEYCK
jgi:hypothetical protein